MLDLETRTLVEQGILADLMKIYEDGINNGYVIYNSGSINAIRGAVTISLRYAFENGQRVSDKITFEEGYDIIDKVSNTFKNFLVCKEALNRN